MFKAGSLPVNKLISKVISLEKINEGFDELEKGITVRQLISFD